MASACSVAVATESKSGGGVGGSSDFLKTSASSCVLVTVSLICACFLVVCGVLVVREYSLAIAYEETKCHLKNITYSANDINCIFCAGFKDKQKGGDVATASCVPSQFPCVRLMVTYGVGDVNHDAVLHPDSLQASGAYSKCSFSVCKKTREENQKAVDDFVEEWRSRRQKTFACFYDTRTSSSVIVQKMYSKSDVIHTMLWPSLIVVACAVIFLRIEVKRRRLTFCGRRRSICEDLPVNSYRRTSFKLEMSPKEGRRELHHVLLGSSWMGTGHEEGCMARVSPRVEALDYRTVLSECGCRFVYKSLPSLNFGKTTAIPNAIRMTEHNGKRAWLHRSVSTDEGYMYDSNGT